MWWFPAALTGSAAWAGSGDEPPLAGLDATIFRPAFHGMFLGVEDGTTTDPGALGRVAVSWARDPVVYRLDAGGERPVFTSVTTVDTLVAYTSGRLRLGLQAPVTVAAIGPDTVASGLGDVRLDGFVSIADGLAVDARVSLPTSGVEGYGLEGPGGDLLVAAGARLGRLQLALDTGPSFGPEPVPGVRRGWLAMGGVGVHLSSALAVGAEADLRVPYTSAPIPAVGRVSGSVALSPESSFRIAVGRGLGPGFGAPELQVMAGLTLVPPAPEVAAARRDAPPVVDTARDVPPDPEPVVVPPADPDGDGVAGDEDSCPEVPEDRDGAWDEDGCPEPFVAVTVHLRGSESLPEWQWVEVRDPDGALSPMHEDGGSWVYLVPTRGENTLLATAPGFVPFRTPLAVDQSVEVDVELQVDRGFPLVLEGDLMVPRLPVRWKGDRLLGLDPLIDTLAPLLWSASGWRLSIELAPPNGDGGPWVEQLRAAFRARGISDDRWSAQPGPGPERISFRLVGPRTP